MEQRRRRGKRSSRRASPASPGIAVGELRRFHTPSLDVPDDPGGRIAASELSRTRGGRSRDRAMRSPHSATRSPTRAGEDEARIFDAHLLFLRDAALLGPAREAIARRAAQRCSRVARRRRGRGGRWDVLDDEYLRARAVDLRSVGTQVLARILGVVVPGTAARRARHPRRRRPDPRRHGGSRSGDGPRHRHGARRPDVARRRARASARYPGGRGRGTAGALELTEGSPLAVDGARGEVVVDPPPDVVEAVRVRATGTRPHDWRVACEGRRTRHDPRRHGHRGGRERGWTGRGRGRGRRGRRRHRAVPDRVPLHGSRHAARRARAGGRLPCRRRGARRTTAAGPHPRRGGRQAGGRPGAGARGESVPGGARHPARPRPPRAAPCPAPGVAPRGRRSPRPRRCSPWSRRPGSSTRRAQPSTSRASETGVVTGDRDRHHGGGAGRRADGRRPRCETPTSSRSAPTT